MTAEAHITVYVFRGCGKILRVRYANPFDGHMVVRTAFTEDVQEASRIAAKWQIAINGGRYIRPSHESWKHFCGRPMIKVYVIRLKRQANWWMRYRDPITGRQVGRSSGTPDKPTARNNAAKWEMRINEEIRATPAPEGTATEREPADESYIRTVRRFVPTHGELFVAAMTNRDVKGVQATAGYFGIAKPTLWKKASRIRSVRKKRAAYKQKAMRELSELHKWSQHLIITEI